MNKLNNKKGIFLRFGVEFSFLLACQCVECWVGRCLVRPHSPPPTFFFPETAEKLRIVTPTDFYGWAHLSAQLADQRWQWLEMEVFDRLRRIGRWPGSRLIGGGGCRVGGPAAGGASRVPGSRGGARYCAHLAHHLPSALPTTWTGWPMDQTVDRDSMGIPP